MNETDPSGLSAHAPGAKLDAGKPLVWLMIKGFSRALTEVAQVTSVGARKYSPGGWQHVEDGSERYMEAFGRHALKLAKGEEVDQDTRCLHKAQMIWNLLASLELELRAKARDDVSTGSGTPPAATPVAREDEQPVPRRHSRQLVLGPDFGLVGGVQVGSENTNLCFCPTCTQQQATPLAEHSVRARPISSMHSGITGGRMDPDGGLLAEGHAH